MNEAPDCFINILKHPSFMRAFEAIKETLDQPNCTGLIILTGPPGVGKSAVAHAIRRWADKCAQPEMLKDPNMIPYCYLLVKSPALSPFSWRDTNIRLLEELGHPFTDSLERAPKAPPWTRNNDLPDLAPVSSAALNRFANDRLFRILQKTIRIRRPKVIILDEAHHLLRVKTSKAFQDQLEHLKFMADETKTPLLLIGTYQLTGLLDLNGALIRRRTVVHLPRYNLIVNDDSLSLDEFAQAVAEFNVDLGRVSDVNLLKIVPELYAGSVGCVGLLRDWLYRAWVLSIKSTRRRITKDALEKAKMSAYDLLNIVREAKEGERYFMKRGHADKLLDAELAEVSLAETTAEQILLAGLDTPPPGKSKRRVGKRNPHQDAVGLDHIRNTKSEG